MVNAIAGFVIAFLLAAVPGKAAISWLARLGAKQTISEDAPKTHSAKQGTPTMGGLMILFALTVTVLPYFVLFELGAHRHPVSDYTLLAVLLLTLAFGAIGFIDDFLSARRGKNMGFRAREKFAAQCIVAVGFAFYMASTAQQGLTTHVALLPYPAYGFGLTWSDIDLGWWYYPLAVLFLVGFSNATNITDGLDGLSSGVTILISVALGTLVAESVYPSLGFFCFALAGGLAGFLWWNAHPAKVFMGDTGSLALGAALAGVAMVAKQEVGLIVASLVCWAELISVMIQVTVFKWRRRTHGLDYAKAHRVFRKSPLHHHFEECGWPETQVVTRFWLAGAICALLAMLWRRG